MAGGAVSNGLSSMKGIFSDGAAEKAILYIYLTDISKPKTPEDTKADTIEVKKWEKSLMKKTKDTISATDAVKGAASGIASFFTPGSKNQQTVGSIDKDNDKFLKFEFQYNPATLRLYSVNGKVQEKNNMSSSEQLHIMKFQGKSKLSFDIIFDDCDNMNAFMFNEVSNFNLTGAANKVKSLVQNGGNTHSVRKRMDAIMSLLSTPSTQQVVFFWSRMVFRGTITSVSNRFTMFNPEGNPIRGQMHIEITQDKKYKDKLYDEQYWTRAFNECFKEPDGGMGIDGVAGVAGGSGYGTTIMDNPFINI